MDAAVVEVEKWCWWKSGCCVVDRKVRRVFGLRIPSDDYQ
jgi:hypothetical protein